MSVLLPLLFAILVWWASTGVILRAALKPRETHWNIAILTSVLAIGATLSVVALRDRSDIWAAYAGFLVGICLWAWHEVMFLFGYLAGPRKTPCPPDLPPWRRFVVSAEAVIHHELAIAIHAVMIGLLSFGAENMVAAQTFYLLWIMRISTKLVLFFGVRNVAEHFLPKHLGYLASYFHKGPNRVFFPIALIIVTTITIGAAYGAITSPAGTFEATGLTLVASLAALAVIEHFALVTPLPDSAIWSWASGASVSPTKTDISQGSSSP